MIKSESSCVEINHEIRVIIDKFVENECKDYLTEWAEEEIELFKILFGGYSSKCFFLFDSVHSPIASDDSKLVTGNIVISGNKMPIITELAKLFFPSQNSVISRKIQALLSVVPKETKETIVKCRNVAVAIALKLTQSVQSYYQKGMVLPVHVSKAISSMLAYLTRYANDYESSNLHISSLISSLTSLCDYYPSSAIDWQIAIANAINPTSLNVNAEPFIPSFMKK